VSSSLAVRRSAGPPSLYEHVDQFGDGMYLLPIDIVAIGQMKSAHRRIGFKIKRKEHCRSVEKQPVYQNARIVGYQELGTWKPTWQTLGVQQRYRRTFRDGDVAVAARVDMEADVQMSPGLLQPGF
jgi:hypothetical protein